METYHTAGIFIFLSVYLCATSCHIPSNLSEGLIFCCSDDEVEVKNLNLNQPEPQPTTLRVPSVTSRNISLYIPEGVVPQDYHGIHTSIPIRSRRPSERECLKNTQPSSGCIWFYENGTVLTFCRRFVISGTPAQPGEFPYMAAVGFASGNETIWTCGGTLISKKFVLTAAHCAFSRITGKGPSSVRLGAHNIKDPDDVVYDSGVASTFVHPNYTLTIKYHDIALLELETPLFLYTNRIKAACLWQGGELESGKRPTALGWGSTTYPQYSMSNILLKGLLDLIPQRTCQRIVRPSKRFPQLTEQQVCAMDLKGKINTTVDTCQGDSGGPLLTNDSRDAGYEIPYIIGITSFGKSCAARYPGIYTRTSSYISWIESIVWPDSDKLLPIDDLWN